MAGEKAFQVEGVVIEALPNGTYRAELSNGHRVLAFVAGRARREQARLAPGSRVRLQLSPYDLSEGRILADPERDPIL
jgi:translation initiation factor IF-1